MTVSHNTRRLVVTVVLCMLIVWPAAHRMLVARYDTNPWKLFGWAMYCRPPIVVRLAIEPTGAVYPSDPAVPGDWQLRVDRFLYRRKHVGTLAQPRALARSVLDLNPDLQGIRFVVTHLRLDSRSATIAPHRYEYTYTQPAR